MEQTQFVQVGFKESMVRELQAEADRRALPLRTMIRSILAEHLAGARVRGVEAPGSRETS